MTIMTSKSLLCVIYSACVPFVFPFIVFAAEQKTPDSGAAAGREAEARLNLLQGKSPAQQKQLEEAKPVVFHGFNLSAAPVTIDIEKLPDLFEDQPSGSKSYHLRKDLKVLSIIEKENGIPTAQVFEIPGKNTFYVQCDGMGASTLHYYGPFQGDPMKVMKLEGDKSIQIRQTTTSSSGAN
jgi:hypothetical protein